MIKQHNLLIDIKISNTKNDTISVQMRKMEAKAKEINQEVIEESRRIRRDTSKDMNNLKANPEIYKKMSSCTFFFKNG